MKKLFTLTLALLLALTLFTACNTTPKNSGSEDSSITEANRIYKDFTPGEKQLFTQYIGEIIPFIANDEYYVEGYYDVADYENGINFYTYGNTEEEFEAYRLKFDGYKLVDTYTDMLGDLWYTYEKEGVTVDLAFYVEDNKNCVDVYVCVNANEEDSSSSSVEDSSDSGSSGGDQGGDNVGEDSAHTYESFTQEERALFNEYFGEVIPFIANDEYYVEEYAFDNEIGLNFYTFGNTQAEFNAYLAKFSSYLSDGTDVDEFGDTWYYFSKGDLLIDVSFYYYEGEYVMDLYAYRIIGSGDGEQGGEAEEKHLYTDFTQEEKQLFISYFGEVIPFIANNEYYVEEYTLEDEEGINFYAFDNTQAEFNAYLAKFSSYLSDGTDVDEYGDTWYYFSKGDLLIDVSFYYYEGAYVVDLYAYYLTDSGEQGGGSQGGDVNENLMTNAGKGLPTGENGVYSVDFTKAKYVKNVTELGTYLDGCPTVSTNKNPAVLVIPVEFSDATASSKGYTVEKIEKAFKGEAGETDYYSVHDYYYISSAGKLDLDITVYNAWFRPSKTSSYYLNATYDYYGEEVAIGDQLIIDEFLASVAGSMDLSVFDSDKNNIIDAIVLINTLEVNDQSDFNWAYRYWNIYTDEEGYYYEYDGVSANDYLWASYQFMHEGYDEEGNLTYENASLLNTYTYIHEFGHVLGADDYYDYAGVNDPMGGCDMMDGLLGDHSAFTKFNFGWITTSRLITCEQSVTLELESFVNSGDTVIIANDWDEELGLYQEYYIVAYYTNEGLNGGDAGFFSRDGIVVYHVNASLYKEVYDGEAYYDIYNTNTDVSDSYGTAENLIEFVKSPEDTFTYVVGDSLSNTIVNDLGNKIAYTFTVDSLENGVATLTFTKNS